MSHTISPEEHSGHGHQLHFMHFNVPNVRDNIGDQKVNGIVENSNLMLFLHFTMVYSPGNLLGIASHFFAIFEKQMQLTQTNKTLKDHAFFKFFIFYPVWHEKPIISRPKFLWGSECSVSITEKLHEWTVESLLQSKNIISILSLNKLYLLLEFDWMAKRNVPACPILGWPKFPCAFNTRILKTYRNFAYFLVVVKMTTGQIIAIQFDQWKVLHHCVAGLLKWQELMVAIQHPIQMFQLGKCHWRGADGRIWWIHWSWKSKELRKKVELQWV